MSRITQAREAAKILRIRWEAEMEREWAKRSAVAEQAVADAVWEARQAGVSVAQIAREYGTKNRGTIYAILKEQEALRAYTGTTDTPTLTFVPLTDDTTQYKVIAHGWVSALDPRPPYTGTIGIKITRTGSLAGALAPITTEGYDVGTQLFRELQAWRSLDASDPTVLAFCEATGLTREGGQ